MAEGQEDEEGSTVGMAEVQGQPEQDQLPGRTGSWIWELVSLSRLSSSPMTDSAGLALIAADEHTTQEEHLYLLWGTRTH